MTSYDLSKALGHVYAELPVSWTMKDMIAYAVGIGATKDDLKFVYELDKSFAMFPTYPVVLGLKGDASDVTDFNAVMGGKADVVPGLPDFDPNRIVHGSQSIEILKEGGLPVQSGDGWKLTKRVVGVHENKSGIIVEHEAFLVDAKGEKYARLVSSTFNVGAKSTPTGGNKFSKAIAHAPASSKKATGAPKYVITESTSEEQALVYRLSGDYNPLHIDPRIGQKAGFGGVILHGLSTYGFAARAVLKAVGSDAELMAFGVRFTSPVKPGDSLETSIWQVGSAKDGEVAELAFVTKNLTSGKVCLGNGVAFVKKAAAGIKAKL